MAKRVLVVTETRRHEMPMTEKETKKQAVAWYRDVVESAGSNVYLVETSDQTFNVIEREEVAE